MNNKMSVKTNKSRSYFKPQIIPTTGLIKYDEKVVPNDLKVNPFFLNVLSLDADKMFEYNLSALKAFGYENVESSWHPTDGYIFAKGTMPVCLCAHMDKVPHYKSIRKINRACVIDKKKRIIDVWLNSKQGIGGDDRCGVFAILQMLKLGYRPSVLFCMGEEIGCCGSHKFTEDHTKDFLSDINAFIQIDRRGNHDVVRYSDTNDELIKTIEKFGFSRAFGSCTDISVLMPYFGISGVNLSSGYYREHSGEKEYVSIKDVNYLLKRLNKILSSDIFAKKYVYKAKTYSYDYSGYYNRHIGKPHSYKQLSLINDMPYIEDQYGVCDCCGEYCEQNELVEIDSPYYDLVCKDCAEDFISQGYTRCPTCSNLSFKETTNKDPKFVHDFCPYCGTCLDDDD